MQLHWPFDLHQPHPTPLLFAYSATVLPRPSDWTAPHIHIPGYLFLDTAASFEPPRALEEFLQAGEPPVCVTFGSMVNREASRVHNIVLAALKETGRRGILLRGWGDTGPERSDSRMLYQDAVPHEWLFPRCKTIVHHGGAGTAAAALQAGVPGIIVPHGADQAFWGRRIASIGAGPAPIPVKRLSVELLTAALAQAEQPALRECAQAVGRQICSEDGVGECVRLIEEHAEAFR
jgi:UDP:flavonoid glycosyltransferase YjiC (YdhE family)